MRRSIPLVLVLAVALVALPAFAWGEVLMDPTPDVIAAEGEVPRLTFEADHARRLQNVVRHDRMVAQAQVPMNAGTFSGLPALVIYDYGDATFMDGWTVNPNVSDVTDIEIVLTYHDSIETELGSDSGWSEAWVLPQDGWSQFRVWMDMPAGTNHIHYAMYGWETTEGYATVTVANIGGQVLPTGERERTIRITNNNSFTVVGATPFLYETFTPSSTMTTAFFDCRLPVENYQSRLAPGEMVELQVYGLRSVPTEPGNVLGWWSSLADAVPAPPASPVYRFYNKRTGTHFYTIDAVEANRVASQLGWLYQLDGVAYNAYPAWEIDSTPLYRFYNMRNGAHFFTADPSEANNIIATMSSIYQYEGPGFYVADSGGLATSTAYRLYNRRIGVHFYTIDPSERDYIVANLGYLYGLEGEAFHVPR